MNAPDDAIVDRRTPAGIDKMQAEARKLIFEPRKMARERSWYPAIVVATAVAAGAAFAKLFV